MKKLRIMICVFALTSLFCVPVLADSYVLGCNSSRGLAQGRHQLVVLIIYIRILIRQKELQQV